MQLKTVILSSTLLWSEVAGFLVPPLTRCRFGVTTQFMSEKPDPTTVSIAERYFQLEEMEDADACETEIYLNADSSVTLGLSDGPKFVRGQGSWNQAPDGSFQMVLKRVYPAGYEKRADTDMGEFEYEIERSFTGEMTYVGENIAVSGVVHLKDEYFGDEEVGYFNMMDTTKAREESE